MMSKEVSVAMLCASVQEAMKKKGFSTESIRIRATDCTLSRLGQRFLLKG